MNPAPNLSWILDELVSVQHARHAVLLSADGLMTATSEGVDRDLGDSVAALTSGLQSLSRAAAVFASGGEDPWEQTLVQFGNGFIFIVAAGEGTFLVVSAGRDVDIEAMSFRMGKTIDRVGQELGLAPRQTPVGGA
ncbi:MULTISPECIES: roadblock/LC7 domain-containing protein [unclassified Streptomyces]|uniref:roadblock/LC7 domain-containing protein n=1 Tax=unclassified Streptomyces TaxID=2593676 RepID=UPI000CD4BBC2|nr:MULTISPECIES: roadblock/LC7 domain-containing protein [unclassified Streptomyces]